jgi:hypothetical protein
VLSPLIGRWFRAEIFDFDEERRDRAAVGSLAGESCFERAVPRGEADDESRLPLTLIDVHGING